VDHIKEQIDTTNGQIMKSQVAKLKMEKDSTKLKDSLGKLDNEIKQLKRKNLLLTNFYI